ncbi:MAG TPA: CBS domain-containing protein [Beijerinckiaceae bacterium]|nr:CBS domain-containing protein [Beijerinckiaceae bacterium]
MVTDVITLNVDDTVQTAAQVLLDRRISGAPVLDAQGRLVGMVSEGDLIRRAEIGTEKRRSWWLELLTGAEDSARNFVRAHAVKLADVMTRDVIGASEDSSLNEIATLLEKHGIKRVPIMRDGKVVGIVSRANLLQALASAIAVADATTDVARGDQALRGRVVDQIRQLPWGMPWLVTVTVQNGVVELWGPVQSEGQRQALRVAAEATPGVRAVKENLYRLPAAAE